MSDARSPSDPHGVDAVTLLQAIADTSSDVIFAKDLRGRMLFANPATLALIGKPRGAVLGRTDLEFLEDEDVARRVMENDRAIMEGGAPTEIEEEVPLPDGTHRVWWSRKIPYRDRDGNVIGLLGISRDITERKREREDLARALEERWRAEEELRAANEQLLEADRRKDEFLGMLSHELRNPLAPIRNSVYLLEHAAPTGEQAARARAVIRRQVDHLTRLVDDLLDVTRIGRGKIELRRSRVDLRQVVLRAAEDFRAVLDERGTEFRVAVPAEEVWAEIDGTRVTQVVGNLLSNAAKFTRAGDRVTLSVHAGAETAEIRVRDTGGGIEPALLPRVFDAFVQGERTLARTDGGLGLGLALVKGITELHGGSARVESAGPGRGSEFVVALPVAGAATQEPSVAERRSQAAAGRRVLVVDDNVDAAESLADMVEMLGHSVVVAFDGPSAVARCRDSPPDVVLCDIGLPGMSGYDIARVLRSEHGQGVRLVAVSGYAQPEDVKAAIDAGFDAHVAKPPHVSDIERLLS